MEWIKDKVKNLPILYVFIFYMILLTCFATLIIEICKVGIYNLQMNIVFKYVDSFSAFNGHGIKVEDVFIPFSNQDQWVMTMSNFLESIMAPIIFGISTVIAALLFYTSKLKRPIALLQYATDKISNNDLEFTTKYDALDEMGKLCDAFEKMHLSLKASKLETWKEIEARKRLGQMFSHDLRTPMTVIKGHTQMLLKYLPEERFTKEQIIKMLEKIEGQISRLEDYIKLMNQIQSLEERPLNRTRVQSELLFEDLEQMIGILGAQKTIHIKSNCKRQVFQVDQNLILEVVENLISNAIVFSKECVDVEYTILEDFLAISVYDDGDGFTKEDLKRAVEPFYKGNKQAKEHHLGLGLNICQILCEKHGGKLKLSNTYRGGKVEASFKL